MPACDARVFWRQHPELRQVVDHWCVEIDQPPVLKDHPSQPSQHLGNRTDVETGTNRGRLVVGHGCFSKGLLPHHVVALEKRHRDGCRIGLLTHDLSNGTLPPSNGLGIGRARFIRTTACRQAGRQQTGASHFEKLAATTAGRTKAKESVVSAHDDVLRVSRAAIGTQAGPACGLYREMRPSALCGGSRHTGGTRTTARGLKARSTSWREAHWVRKAAATRRKTQGTLVALRVFSTPQTQVLRAPCNGRKGPAKRR